MPVQDWCDSLAVGPGSRSRSAAWRSRAPAACPRPMPVLCLHPTPGLGHVREVVPGAALAQDGEAGEIRLHHRVVAGAVRVPTAASFDEGGTDLHRVGALGIPALRAVRTETPGAEAPRGTQAHAPPP